MTKGIRWIIEGIETMAETARQGDLCWRASYTTEDRKCLALLERWMKEKGLHVHYDYVGNLFGRIPGKCQDIILIGSHRDTVKNGGKYDGVLGILTALEASASLVKELGMPSKTIEVVALCEEEGSRFLSGYIGSRAITGKLKQTDLLEEDDMGVPLKQAITACGYSDNIMATQSKLQQFIELHIEQGSVLENRKKQIGIVTAISGLMIGKLKITGHQNHAGTTPMSLRIDPVPKAAEIIDCLTKWVRTKEDRIVCTFGQIVMSPGKSNVIPEFVEVSFDIRSESIELLDAAKANLQKKLEEDNRFSYELDFACEDLPVVMDPEGVENLRQITERLGIQHMDLVSGAGHDAQIFASEVKTNMIFVPSRNGISHSPEEYTAEEDILAGYTVLKEFLKESAW